MTATTKTVSQVLSEAQQQLIHGNASVLAVAARLRKANCKGCRRTSMGCPLSVYYTRALREAGFSYTVSVGAGVIFPRGLRAVEGLFASPVEILFQHRFDEGGFPALALAGQ